VLGFRVLATKAKTVLDVLQTNPIAVVACRDAAGNTI
jgi:hypothetical protein